MTSIFFKSDTKVIFNKILTQLGEEPKIIFYEDRFQYYEAISDFRAEFFNGHTFYV